MPEIGRPQNHNPFQNIEAVRKGPQFVDKNKHSQLDKHTFLKLLSQQLKNQDPLSPTDQKKFAADLAQFSQLEQLANINNQFEREKNQAPQQMKFMGASFLGKEIRTQGTSVEYDGQSPHITLPFYLARPAKKVMVRVFDQSHNIVNQLELKEHDKGSQHIAWDGRSLDGTRAKKGHYRFEVLAWDKQLTPFKGETKAKGLVTAVSFEGNEVVLTVNGKDRVYLRDVDNFSLAE